MNAPHQLRSIVPVALNLLALVAALVALGVFTVTPAEPGRSPVTVRLAECLDGPMRTADRPTLRLACRSGGGPWKGAAGGRGAGSGASGGAWTGNPTYGRPARGNTPVEAHRMARIQKMAKRYKVPWPSKTSWRATHDFEAYGVYNLYAKTPSGVRVFKYGITKRGATRPRSQLGACNRWARATIGPAASCSWAWTRQDVQGFLKARRIEAGHATKYKHRHGHCPPGMTRCL